MITEVTLSSGELPVPGGMQEETKRPLVRDSVRQVQVGDKTGWKEGHSEGLRVPGVP